MKETRTAAIVLVDRDGVEDRVGVEAVVRVPRGRHPYVQVEGRLPQRDDLPGAVGNAAPVRGQLIVRDQLAGLARV
jgi:hypothetical protein